MAAKKKSSASPLRARRTKPVASKLSRKKTSTPTAKSPAGVPTLLACGFVEGPFIERGWACCSCREKLGVAVYNGAQRRVCKECGHKRCAGAMRRAWPEGRIGVPAKMRSEAAGMLESPYAGPFGNLLRALAAMAGGKLYEPPKAAPVGKEDPQWQKACDEVIAAFASAHLQEEPTKVPNVASITKHVKADLPRAIEIFGQHPPNAPPCKCRHYSIISAGAERAARTTGESFGELVHNGIEIVERYLASRN